MKNKYFRFIAVFILVLSLSACVIFGETPAPPDNDPTPVGENVADQDVDGDDHKDDDADTDDAAHDDDDGADDTGGEEDTESVPATPAIDGAALFVKGKCAGCHGENRTGLFAPSILPKDLTKDPAAYIEIITKGVDNTQMPAHKDKFSEQEIEALVDWLMTAAE